VATLIRLARKVFTWLPGAQPNPHADPLTLRLKCKRCGSSDIWRIQAASGFYSEIMKARNMKPFECRMCRKMFYLRARRKDV
jgi:hypothetical protein